MTTALTISKGLTFTPLGLVITKQYTITVEEWLQAGLSFRQFVSTIDAAVAFCYGDWLNLGEQVLGEDYAQGLDVVLPVNPDDFQLQKAEKTIYQYRRLARETPKWMRGLPGLSARHYLDAIRIADHHARYEHLVKASTEGLSVRQAAKELPPPNGELPPPPATKDDVNHQLTVENHKLRNELNVHRALIDEAGSNIEQARGILIEMVDELPTKQAQRVQQAIDCLTPVVVQSEFIEFLELTGQAIDLYDSGEIAAMVDVMERLRILRKEMLNQPVVIENQLTEVSARADTIAVNDVAEFRPDWLAEIYE